MKLEIISPEGKIFSGEVNEVSFPGIQGRFDVLPHHAPMISALNKGIIEYFTEGKVHQLSVNGGFIEINNDIISVCIE